MRVLIAVLLGVWASCGAFTQETPDLRADARLQESLSLTEPLISLRDLIQKVQIQTGAPLAVAPEIAEDKICVLVSDKPAYEVLNRIASSLRYRWQWGTDGKTYVLRMPAVERQRERDLYQLAQRNELQYQQETLRQAIALTQQYSLQQIQEAVNNPDFFKNADRETRSLWTRLSTSSAYCAARALGLLPEAVRERIWTAHRFTLGSDLAKYADAPLPPAIERQMLSLLRAMNMNDEESQRLKSVEIIYLPCSQWLNLHFIAVSEAGIEQHLTGAISLSRWDASQRSVVESHALCKVWREWQTDFAELRRLPAAPRAERKPPLTIPEPLQGSAFDVLMNWARSRNLDLYADVYRVRPEGLRRGSRNRPEQTPLEEEAIGAHFEWVAPQFWLRLEGDTLMARHKDYYWLRPSEIPERLLRPLEAKIERREPITLDEWADFATALTPMQLERATGGLRLNHLSGERIVHATTIPMEMTVHTTPALRFWASLTPAQRATVQRGDPLLLERLSPIQRQRFREAFHPTPLTPCVSQAFFSPSMTFRDAHFTLFVPEYWFSESVRRLGEAEARPERFQMRVAGIAPPYSITESEGRLSITLGATPFREPSHPTDKGYLLSFIAEGKERAYMVYQTVPAIAGSEVELPRR